MRSRALATARSFAAGVAIFCLAASPAGAGTKDRPAAPDWTLKDVDGRTIRLADYRGKVVILDFWATWCPPCRKEIPGLIKLQEKYAAGGLAVIGITLDEDPPLVAAVARKLNVNYPVVFGTPLVAAAYGEVAVLPSTFVIDKNGKIVVLHEGLTTAATIEAEIKPLL